MRHLVPNFLEYARKKQRHYSMTLTNDLNLLITKNKHSVFLFFIINRDNKAQISICANQIEQRLFGFN